jgi:SagB-type dehydrogenase family enzyme
LLQELLLIKEIHIQMGRIYPLWMLSSMAFAALTWLTACNSQMMPGSKTIIPQLTPSIQSASVSPALQMIQLPAPKLKGDLTLEEALARRRSMREFSDVPLTLEELGQLLWSAQGINHPAGYRTAPSAGALYPLEIYLVTQDGSYHYDVQGHRLSLHQQGDIRPALYKVARQQEPVLKASAVFVISAVYERTEKKYGKARSPRYVHLEAGHAAQNLLLQAVGLDLGAVPIGAFIDEEVKAVLSLPDDHQPLYLIPVGHPE